MGSKEEAIQLYLLGVQNWGITKAVYDELNDIQRTMVHPKPGARDGSYALNEDVRSLFSVALSGGVFDIIHPGHIHTLQEARKQADVLVVVVATDETVTKAKGREPLHTQNERAELAGALKPVDLAIVGVSRWQDTLARVSPDVVVFGYDQKPLPLPPELKVVQLTTHHPNPNSKTGKVREAFGL
ncbi:FAD synthase [uncultured archaeon]|nr:FAD synthase [uncultured archaeon]